MTSSKPQPKNIGLYIISYLSLYIFTSLIILQFFISIVPEQAIVQARITAILTVFLNSGITLSVLTSVFLLLWLILKYIGVDFSISDLYPPAIWFLLGACFYEFIRLSLAILELKPLLSYLTFSTAEEYIFFIENELPGTRWQFLETVLDNVFLLSCPLLFGLGLRTKLKSDWMDALLCGLVTFLGLFLLRAFSSSFDPY